ncbi:hypothetical protein, partial [Burkholderia vietnamiensis]|uniref:hypothetical protein n=1 Tax=Burkholderia vietnamiensis TaxID=60552 RepID=UPI001ABB678A
MSKLKLRARQRTRLFQNIFIKGLHCEGRVHRITPLSRYRKRGAGEEGKRCGWVDVVTQVHTKLNPSPSQR